MSELRTRLLKAGAAGLAAVLLGLLLAGWAPVRGLFDSLESRLTDLRMRSLPWEPVAGDDQILIVDIDARSIDKLGRFHNWSRARLAELVAGLHAGGVRAVVFDLLLDAGPDSSADAQLLAALQASGRVVAGAGFSVADSAAFLYAMRTPPVELAGAALAFAGDSCVLWPQERLESGLPGLQSVARWGFVNARPDPDGVIRRAPLLASFGGQVWPSLALAAAVPALGWSGLAVQAGPRTLTFTDPDGAGRRSLSHDGRGNLLLRYRGPWRSFRTVSFYDVLEGRLPAGFLQNKIVLVGSSLAGLADLKPVPLQAAFPGVEIQATVLSNLLAGDPLRATGWRGLGLMLLLAALPSALAFTQRRAWLGLLLLVATAGLLWAVSLAALAGWGLLLPVALPASAGLLAGGGALVQRLLGEERQRRWLAGAFSRYVSEEVLQELLRHPERLCLGGERRTLSLLFCDIRAFTSMSERVPPAELGGLLNRYLTVMSQLILEQGGTLDKYIGDAIVALFGAPVEQEDHARRALLAALAMQERLATLRAEFSGTPFEELEIGIGVHCGPVLVGNFGSDLRFDFTAIGDAMNLASRLECLTKSYGCRILVSPDILAAAGPGFHHRLLDHVRVMGKQTPVELHELFAPGLERGELCHSFEAARLRYATGDFSAGAAALRSHLELFPEDAPARALLARCDLLAGSPRSGWDGVWQMDRK